MRVGRLEKIIFKFNFLEKFLFKPSLNHILTILKSCYLIKITKTHYAQIPNDH